MNTTRNAKRYASNHLKGVWEKYNDTSSGGKGEECPHKCYRHLSHIRMFCEKLRFKVMAATEVRTTTKFIVNVQGSEHFLKTRKLTRKSLRLPNDCIPEIVPLLQSSKRVYKCRIVPLIHI